MNTPLPEIEDDFTAASDGGLIDISRHVYIALSFTVGAVADYFDLNLVHTSLTEDEELKKYILTFELMDGANEQDKECFLEMRMALNETIIELRHCMENGLCAPTNLNLNIYAEEGFSVTIPDLADLVALYSAISTRYDLKWEDPKTCVEQGFDYSLTDITQALALFPEAAPQSDEDDEFDYSRPVDMGLPKIWLQ